MHIYTNRENLQFILQDSGVFQLSYLWLVWYFTCSPNLSVPYHWRSNKRPAPPAGSVQPRVCGYPN